MKELATLNDLLLFQKPWLNEMKQKLFLQIMVDKNEHIRGTKRYFYAQTLLNAT